MNFYTNVSLVGDGILYRAIENGVSVKRVVRYQPTLFVPSNKESEHRTLSDQYVESVQPGTISDCRDFVKQYEGIPNFKIYGNTDYVYQYIGDEFPDEVDYDMSKIIVAHIDIETQCEHGFPQVDDPQESVIGITLSVNGKKYVLGLGEFHIDGVDCRNYEYEEDLLADFLEIWKIEHPDIVTGWNIKFFDIPYLVQRMNKLLTPVETSQLSPWKKIREKFIERSSKRHRTFQILGVSILDYLDLYKTFTYTNQESYRLDHIAFVELGERKLDYGEYETIRDFYRNDFQKFMEYNVRDVELIEMLEDKMKLLELALALAYSAKVNYEDVFSQVRTWDQIIYHHLRKQNIVIPPKKGGKKDEKYAGAYVKDPITGMHDWIVSFDLNSLYPHLIMQYNISPETLVRGGQDIDINSDSILASNPSTMEGIKRNTSHGYAVAANGTCYKKDSLGFLPELMHKMYAERKEFKNKMISLQKEKEKTSKSDVSRRKSLEYQIAKYNNFQLVRKIQLNSAYGAIGNQYFRYYATEMAEAITASGQLSIRWIADKLNEFLNMTIGTTGYDYVVASDTDSVYIRLSKLVDKFLPACDDTDRIIKFLDESSNQIIQPFIDKQYEELSTLMNAYENKMQMGREVIAERGVWTAKKRYALNVWDSEGVRYEEPKLKIMGIETTRSSTPAIVREKLKDAIRLILTTDEETIQKYVLDFKSEFFACEPENIAFPRGVSNLEDYASSSDIYKKATPIAVKGSLIYNHYIKKAKLETKYEKIQQGDKIKFIYLKEPNPIGGSRGDKVISFPTKIPKELDLHRFVDYDKQFVKSFLDPLETILGVIGWKSKEVATLEGLFI
jgi:DNA polymerase elongation subunit (family B)